jgi:hypothetical protein
MIAIESLPRGAGSVDVGRNGPVAEIPAADLVGQVLAVGSGDGPAVAEVLPATIA